MKDHDLDRFERAARQRLSEFLNPELKRRPKSAPSPVASRGWTVTLAVRMKQLSMDTQFVFHSDCLSKLQSQIEAEQAARAAGWPIVGYVYDIRRR